MLKSDLRYHVPLQGCVNCVHSYFNTYGDACCTFLQAEDIVDLYGMCDKYEQTQETKAQTVMARDAMVPVADLGTCMDCSHSYMDDKRQARCKIDGACITDTDNSCPAWELEYGY